MVFLRRAQDRFYVNIPWSKKIQKAGALLAPAFEFRYLLHYQLMLNLIWYLFPQLSVSCSRYMPGTLLIILNSVVLLSKWNCPL